MKNQYEKLPKYIHSQIANALKKTRLKRKLSKEDIARQTYLSVLDIIRIEPGLFSPERIFNKISALLKKHS